MRPIESKFQIFLSIDIRNCALSLFSSLVLFQSLSFNPSLWLSFCNYLSPSLILCLSIFDYICFYLCLSVSLSHSPSTDQSIDQSIRFAEFCLRQSSIFMTLSVSSDKFETVGNIIKAKRYKLDITILVSIIKLLHYCCPLVVYSYLLRVEPLKISNLFVSLIFVNMDDCTVM